MEADLLRFYQVDLLDRWRGRLSLRRIRNLVFGLPPDSNVGGILRDGPLWSVEAHLLDELRMAVTSTGKHRAQPHPSRPTGTSRPTDPRVVMRRKRAAERFAERRRAAGLSAA